MSDMEKNSNKFIQENFPDRALNRMVQGEFLQSEQWRKFQERVGRRTYGVTEDNFYASIIRHNLPIVGEYFYVPRGPIIQAQSSKLKVQSFLDRIINLARKENAGWIRIEPNNSRILDLIRANWQVAKAPHDMQPREILVMDITKPEEELLAEMKAKTRYNIKVAQKQGVSLRIANSYECTSNRDIEEFLRLVKITAKRDKITPHPENYYRKLFEAIPGDILKLYVAEYKGEIIAANIVIFFGKTATYLHGASDYEYRSIMAPHLLQWRAIVDAKKAGLIKYDLGGVRTADNKQLATNDWSGITRFKTSFSPDTQPIKFPGSYDIVLNPFKYKIYRILQKVKSLF